MPMPGDIEVYKDVDNPNSDSCYIIDAARLFPPSSTFHNFYLLIFF